MASELEPVARAARRADAGLLRATARDLRLLRWTAEQYAVSIPQLARLLRDQLHSVFPTGLLAHSHAWHAPRSTPLENIEAAWRDDDAEQVGHPRELLDLVCVADLATWTMTRYIALANTTKVRKNGAWIVTKHPTECRTTPIPIPRTTFSLR